METRRDFLVQGGRLLAGLAAAPAFPGLEVQRRAKALPSAAQHERARVRHELHILETEYLPVLLAPRALVFPNGKPTAVYRPDRERRERLRGWQLAVRQLALALEAAVGQKPEAAEQKLDEFRTCFTANARWKGLLECSTQPLFSLDEVAPKILSWMGQEPGHDPEQEILRQLPAFKKAFLAAPADFDWLANAYTTWLPALAKYDLGFVMKALDFRRLVAGLHRDRPITDDLGHFLASVVSCGLAWTMCALAGSHFLAIRNALMKPDVYGNWNCFMPDFLVAALYRKVTGLRDMSGQV